MKKVFLSVMLIPGAIMGAGFCSGKEIVSYFAKFGLVSLLFVPVMFFLYFFIFKLFISFGKKENFASLDDLNKSVFGKGGRISNIFMFFVYLIFSGAMFAGLYEIGQVFGSDLISYALMGIGFVVCFITLIKSLNFLAKINAVLVPFLILLILATCFASFSGFISLPTNFIENSNLGILIFNPLIYACQGLTLSYFILVKVGEDLTKKQINIVSFVASLLLVILQTIIIIVAVVNPEIKDSSIPMLSLALKTGFPFDIIYLITLFISILTTLFITARSLNEVVVFKVKNKRKSALITLVISLIFSVFGFNKIIEWFYPIVGVAGFLILWLVISKLAFVDFFKFANRKIHTSSKNAK